MKNATKLVKNKLANELLLLAHSSKDYCEMTALPLPSIFLLGHRKCCMRGYERREAVRGGTCDKCDAGALRVGATLATRERQSETN